MQSGTTFYKPTKTKVMSTSKKIYTTAYRLGMLNVHNADDKTKAETYARLLKELMQEIADKDLQLK